VCSGTAHPRGEPANRVGDPVDNPGMEKSDRRMTVRAPERAEPLVETAAPRNRTSSQRIFPGRPVSGVDCELDVELEGSSTKTAFDFGASVCKTAPLPPRPNTRPKGLILPRRSGTKGAFNTF